MTFLLGQIATCLLLAFLAGFLLGWLVREISRRDDVSTSVRYADGYGELVTGTNATRYRKSSNMQMQNVLGEVD